MLCSQMHPLDQIFEFNGENGVREMFDATALREYVMGHPECAEYIEDDIEDDWARFIIANRGIDTRTVASTTKERIDDPILGILRADGTTLTIDGHHRYVRRVTWAAAAARNVCGRNLWLAPFGWGQCEPARTELFASVSLRRTG